MCRLSGTCRVVRTMVTQRSFKEVSKNRTWMHEMRRRLVWLGRSTGLLLCFLVSLRLKSSETRYCWGEVRRQTLWNVHVGSRLYDILDVVRSTEYITSWFCQGFPSHTKYSVLLEELELPLTLVLFSTLDLQIWFALRFDILVFLSTRSARLQKSTDVFFTLYTYEVLCMVYSAVYIWRADCLN